MKNKINSKIEINDVSNSNERIESFEFFPDFFQKTIDFDLRKRRKSVFINLKNLEEEDISFDSEDLIKYDKFFQIKKNQEKIVFSFLNFFLKQEQFEIFSLFLNTLCYFFGFIFYLSTDKKFYVFIHFFRIINFGIIIILLTILKIYFLRIKQQNFLLKLTFFVFLFQILTENYLLFFIVKINSLEFQLILIESFFFCTINIYSRYINFVQSIIISLLYFVNLLIGISIFKINYWFLLILIAILLVLLITQKYFSCKESFENFNKIQKKKVTKNQQENLLMHLLPPYILDRFLFNPHKKIELCDIFHDVTILFADIVGFTKFSSSVESNKVLSLLSQLFTEFDRNCLKHNVYKLYTIGDCYVVLGMTNIQKRDPFEECNNIINFGFEMFDIIEKVREKIGFEQLDMRIGIHTGTIIGGIIGTEIVRYDIYGKDVLIANKVESNGVEGEIAVSEKTKILLENNYIEYIFEDHCLVNIPSIKTDIKTYLLYHVDQE